MPSIRQQHGVCPRVTALAAAAVVALVAASCSSSGAKGLPRTTLTPADWPTYGHDAQHTFHGATALTTTSVKALKPAWSFPTGDAVTATPTVVHGVVYVGSWDGNFYAIDLHTGKQLWKFVLDPQHAVTPYPGESPRDITSDGGLVTSSAWFQSGDGRAQPDLVIFGGGYTLYALRAADGALFWKHAYTGRPDLPADPTKDDTRIFSSPVVADGLVIGAVTPDGGRGRRGYVFASALATGKPVWIHDTDDGPDGQPLNDGCGGVWSSGTVLPAADLVVFGQSDCHFHDPPPLSESIYALHIKTGAQAWVFHPDRPDPECDYDFGATVNAGIDKNGRATFLGDGAKDGTYYSLDPATGALRWATNVVFGGFSGGFIATAAYDGHRVYGSTALGDFGRFEGVGMKHCAPGNPRDVEMQNPAVHSIDAATGTVAWEADGTRSFSPTTVAGGMTFNGLALSSAVVVRTAGDGSVLTYLALDAPNWSGIATAGNAIVFGTGASQQGTHTGVLAYTPDGVAPS